MKKKHFFIFAALLLSGCSSNNKNDQTDKIREQERQIECLTSEKRELEMLLESEKRGQDKSDQLQKLRRSIRKLSRNLFIE
ncbi:hypothetical protein [Enterococcus sp. CWB-B31]|uniref:hypothetical protein n=1 Tax=Enterococcus sp. CWB-B31 TaxID=2885159 RepID=UPI001E5B7A7C|nr:hypothetical protein [Enterococcus sp. CWB-B31]MCB5953683.1 hypothetical protein [Enterococcus sp. CWB-B31]